MPLNYDEQLFLRVTAALEQSIASRDWFELLGASARLRQLLLDGQPLAIAANRRARVKLRFNVCRLAPPDSANGLRSPDMEGLLDGIDPTTAPPYAAPGEEVGLRDLLASVTMRLGDRLVTIHDTIDFVAHVAGGVHRGSPKSEQDRAIADLSRFLVVQGSHPALQDLRAIGRVVVRGLAPLRQKLLSSTGDNDSPHTTGTA